ncbi:MAG: MFS transporter [Oscillospiraceae bacterium]|nr:MFS transporter [Oscillospiraceae bacterium]
MSEQGLVLKAKTALTDVKKYWRAPNEGNYVSNREIAVFSGGGIGVKTVNAMVSAIQMTSTSLLVGSVYKLSPSDLFTLFLITNVIGILKTPVVSWLVDNTNTKIGKFRPYLLWAGFPCVAGVIGMTWFVPLDAPPLTKMVLIGIYYNVLCIGQGMYGNAYINLSQVISPNSAERSKIMSISEFVANLGPSIVNIVLPIFANIFFGDEGLLTIEAYRMLLPAFTIAGFLLGLSVRAKTEERVIRPIETREKVRMADGLRQFTANREFVIVAISKFFEMIKNSTSSFFGWICLYQMKNSAMFGILPSIVAFANVPGMLLAPALINRFGYRKLGVTLFSMNTATLIIMLLTFRRGVAFYVIALFLFTLANGPQYILQTSLTADALDQQQLKTNERVESFILNIQGVFGILGGIATMFSQTFIFERFGLAADANGMTSYDVLADAAIREPIISAGIALALAASVFCVLPFFASRMTKQKHGEIIEKLQDLVRDQELAGN